MSQTVDNRVVELQFDNQQFEQGTKESLNTIQKLKEALKFKDAGENLKDLGNVTKNFDLNGIGNAVEQVGEKFSTMRLVGLMALSNIVDGAMQAGKKILHALTSPLEQIKTGGWNRAMNIEQATFQLNGILKNNKAAVDAVMKDVQASVDGTAYSLDAAAKTAAQFAASGVKAGKNMLPALKAVAGTAAMTNSSFEDIGNIFATVAGQGKLMTMQLRQLEARGLNAAATLAEHFKTSEAAVRDMVTKGKVSFNDFSEAMSEAFGEHAAEANNTFQGSLNNIKAALSRIGQNFATPIIRDMVPVFNTIRKFVNALNTAIGNTGLYKFFDEVSSKLSKLTTGALSKFIQEVTIDGKKKTIFAPQAAINFQIFADAIKVAFTNILKILVSIKNAWNKVFTGSAGDNIQKIATGFLKLVKALSPTKQALHGIENIFTALFTVVKKFGTIVGAVVSKVGGPLVSALAKVVNVGLGLIGILLDIVFAIGKFISNSNIVKNIVGALSNLFTSFKNKLSGVSTVIGKFTTVLANGFKLVASIVAGVLAVAINGIIILFNKLRSIDFSNFLNGLINIKNFIVDLLNYVRQLPIVQAIINGIANSFLFLIGIVVKVGEGFVNLVKNIASGKMTFHDFAESLKSIIDKLGGLKTKLSNFLSTNPVILKFVEIFNKLRIAFDGFIKNTAAKIKEIDGVRVILMAFAIGITAMVYKVTGAIGSFSKLLKTGSKAIKTFIESIAPKKTSFFTTFAGNLLKIAAAIAVVAASIKMVANIPADNLERATKSLLMLAGGAAVLALLATVLGSFLKVGKDGFSAFSANMLMFSAGVGILASSLLILDNINMEGIWQKVGILGAIAAGLTGISIVMSKFAPKLTAGSIMMIAFAASVAILVKSLKELTTFDLSNLSGYWKELLALFGGLALLATAIGKIGIGAVAGLVAFVIAWKLISTQIDKLQETIKDVPSKVSSISEEIKTAFSNMQTQMNISKDQAIAAIVSLSVIIGGIIVVLSLIGKGLKDFAKSLVIISAVVVGLIYVSKYISKWLEESSRMGEAILRIGEMMLFVGGLIALSRVGNAETLKQTKKMLSSLAIVMLSMTAFIAVAGKLDEGEWKRATVALEAALITIGGFSVWIASINAKATGTKAGIASFLGIIALFGVMLGALAVLMSQLRTAKDYQALAYSLGAILTLVLFLDSILLALSKVRVGTGGKVILGLFAGLSIVAATIAGIALLLKDQSWKEVASKVGVVTVAVAALTTIAMAIDALIRRKEFNVTKTATANLTQLGLIIKTLIGVMSALTIMSVLLKNVDILDMSGKLLALLTITGLLVIVAQKLAEINVVGGNIKAVITILIALGAVFAELAFIGYALQNVKADQLLFSLSAIAMVILEITVIFGIITKLVKDPKNLGYAAIALLLIAGLSTIFIALGQLGIAIDKLNPAKLHANFNAIIIALGELAGILVALSVVVGVATYFTGGLGAVAIGLAVLALAPMVMMFSIIGDIAVEAGKIDSGTFKSNLNSITLCVLELGGILAALGVLSSLCGLGLIAVHGISEICEALVPVSVALKNLQGMKAGGIKATLEEIGDGLGKIVTVAAFSTAVSTGLITLADSIVKIGSACEQVSTSMSIFAQSMLILEHLKDQLPAISSSINNFFSSFNSGIASQMAQISATVTTEISILTRNIIVSLQSGLQSAAGVAYQSAAAVGLSIVNGFNAGTGASSGSGGFMTKFMNQMKSEAANTGSLQQTFYKGMFGVGQGGINGFRDGTGWHSPTIVEDFLKACGGAVTSISNYIKPYFYDAMSMLGFEATNGWQDGTKNIIPGMEDMMGQMQDMISGTMDFNMDIDASGWFSQLTGIENETYNRVARIKAALGELAAAEFDAKTAYNTTEIAKYRTEINKLKDDMDQNTAQFKRGNITLSGYNSLMDSSTKKIEQYESAIVGLKDKQYLMESEYDKKIKETEADTKRATETNGGYADSLDKVGGSAGKAKEELSQFQESLKSTLEGQMDVFSEFKQSEKHTKEELFKNIESQINGMAAWAVNMDKLSERGIDQGLYQKLAEMGPQGAGYMEAFLSMTQEELAKYNDLWATSLVLPDTVSTMLTGSLQKAGVNAITGLYNGVNSGHAQVVDEFGNIAKESTDTVETEWDEHSPSKIFIEIGRNAMEGLRLGMLNAQGNVFSRITFICQHIVALADTGLQPGKFAEFGGNIVSGLISGIESQEESLWTKIDQLCKDIETKIHNSTLKFGSPSKTMMKYGGWIDEGLAIGIDKKAYAVYDSINNLADSALDTMKLTVANIAAQVNDSFEDPVITPVLDLSNVRAGARDLNNIFNANQAAVRAGSFTSNQNGQQIGSGAVIFNQNNYSPKALSRIEIYRDTRNLFAQAKGALS